MLTRIGLSQTARQQYRLCFRGMAQGGVWSFYIVQGDNGEELRLYRESKEHGKPLLRHVQSMDENRMTCRLDEAWQRRQQG